MSIEGSTVPNRKDAFAEIKSESFSLNEIIKNSIRKLQAHHLGMSLVLRCEVLPEVSGNKQELSELFEQLLQLILAQPYNGSRLMLHIDCAPASSENNTRQQRVNLRIHTNITTDDNWKLVNSQVLAQCKMIVSNHSGNLQVNQITGTGCLFSVTLPGKSE